MLILNDFKVVSKNRIISTCGIVDTISDNCLYKEIKRTLLNDIFEEEVYEYENKIEEMNKIIESEKENIRGKREKLILFIGKLIKRIKLYQH